jgi:SAM-dependent methyltransferase
MRSGRFLLPMDKFIELMEKPEPYAPGDLDFWDDEHISKRALEAHLDPDTDAASRRPEFMDASMRFIAKTAGGLRGKKVLDLGCGPGLYAQRLRAEKAIVTGLDISRSSIAYAKREAKRLHLDIDYRRMDFLKMDFDEEFDLALQIYGEVCTMTPSDRGVFLKKVHRALKPGGLFIFDVITKESQSWLSGRSWQARESGFWKPGPYLVLEYGADYEDGTLHLDQYAIFDEKGKLDLCRIWTTCFTPQSVTEMLEANGFQAVSLHGDLRGAPLADEGWIGVVARKDRDQKTGTVYDL